MSSKVDTEKEWLRFVVIPKITENGIFTENVQIQEIEIKFIGTDESFMLTNCYRASIEYEINGQRSKLHLVVKKTPPVPEEVFNSINFGALFNNEIVAYTKMMPAIEKFTNQKFVVPKYFYSDLQHSSASMVLEDFGINNWRIANDRYNLSLDHLTVAIKYLGEFHGIGFAMRELKRTEFDDIVGQLRESRYDSEQSEDLLLAVNCGIQRILNATRQYDKDINEQFLEKLEKLISDGYKYSKQRVTPIEPYITFCHGDFLRNNIAFRYKMKDNAEIPFDVMMFDLQTMRASSPMLDVAMLLLLSAFSEVRYKNLKLILETYREQLVKTYEMLTKKNAPEYLSFESLTTEYIRYMPFGISIAAFFLVTLVVPIELSPGEFLTANLTPEEIIDNQMTRGGATVDRELAHQVRELYDLSLEYDVDFAEGIHID